MPIYRGASGDGSQAASFDAWYRHQSDANVQPRYEGVTADWQAEWLLLHLLTWNKETLMLKCLMFFRIQVIGKLWLEWLSGQVERRGLTRAHSPPPIPSFAQYDDSMLWLPANPAEVLLPGGNHGINRPEPDCEGRCAVQPLGWQVRVWGGQAVV